METVNTELTAAVVAKAVQSLIATLNIKSRIVTRFWFRKRKAILNFSQTKRGSTMWPMPSKNFLKQKYKDDNVGWVWRNRKYRRKDKICTSCVTQNKLGKCTLNSRGRIRIKLGTTIVRWRGKGVSTPVEEIVKDTRGSRLLTCCE